MSIKRNSMSMVALVLAALVVIGGVALWTSPWKAEEVKTTAKTGDDVHVKVDAKLAAQGKTLADSNGCTSCHTIDGGAGAGPTWAGLWGSNGKVTGKPVDEAYVAAILTTPPAAMTSFKGKFDEQQQAEIAEYIKSLAQ